MAETGSARNGDEGWGRGERSGTDDTQYGSRRDGSDRAGSGAARTVAGRGVSRRSLRDSVVVVTGSSRGIGRETAIRAAAEGAHVVINGRDADRLEETRARIVDGGGSVHAVVSDVTNADGAQGLVEGAVERFGRIDVLINNVGFSMRGLFGEIAPQVMEANVRVNVLGAAYPTRYAIPHLIATGGSIVFISSLVAFFGVPKVSIYSASKMALTGLSQSLRCELAPHGVHVGILYVGLTENDPRKQVLQADGTMGPSRRKFHITQSQVAGAILAMVRRRRKRRVLTPMAKALSLIARLFPGTVGFIIRAVGKVFPDLYG